MLEIILIVYLVKRIGKTAEKKGHAKAKYQGLFVVLWIVFEFLGGFIGAMLSDGETFMAYLFALAGAGLSCLISFVIVNSLPSEYIKMAKELIEQGIEKETIFKTLESKGLFGNEIPDAYYDAYNIYLKNKKTAKD